MSVNNFLVQENALKQALDEKARSFELQLAEVKKEKESLESKHKETVAKLENDISDAKVSFLILRSSNIIILNIFAEIHRKPFFVV